MALAASDAGHPMRIRFGYNPRLGNIGVQPGRVDPAARKRLDRQRYVERTTLFALDHTDSALRHQADGSSEIRLGHAQFCAEFSNGEGLCHVP